MQPPYWDECKKMDFGELRQFVDDSLEELSVDGGDSRPRSKEEFLNLLEMLRQKISASCLPKISPDPGDSPPFPKYTMSKQLEQQLKPLYAQRKELRAELTTAHSNLSRKKGRKRRNATDRRIIKKQIMELQSKLGSIEREITSLKDRERQDYQKRRDASASFRLYNAAKAAHIRSLQQWKAEKQKRFRRGEITERVGKDVERAFKFGTVVPTRRLPWRVLPPGELSVTILHQHYDRLQQVNPRIKYERARITKAFSLRPHQCYIGRDEFEGYMILTFVHTPRALLKRAGLPQIRFHDLRHTCATLLLGRNVNPKIVSEMLGHATIAITLDTYSHVLPNMQSETAKAMEDALS